jgi:hypothetical protein
MGTAYPSISHGLRLSIFKIGTCHSLGSLVYRVLRRFKQEDVLEAHSESVACSPYPWDRAKDVHCPLLPEVP